MLEMVKVYAIVIYQDAGEEKRKFSPADDLTIEPRKVKRHGFRNG